MNRAAINIRTAYYRVRTGHILDRETNLGDSGIRKDHARRMVLITIKLGTAALAA